MIRLTRSAASALLFVSALGLAACGGQTSEADPVTVDGGSQSADTEDSPSEDKTGADEPPASYPQAGLEFELPDVRGDAASALETLVELDVAAYTSQRTLEWDPKIDAMASSAVAEDLRDSIDWQIEHDVRYAGSATIAVDPVAQKKQMAVFDECVDGTELRLITKGKKGPIDGPKKSTARVTLIKAGGGWVETEYKDMGRPC